MILRKQLLLAAAVFMCTGPGIAAQAVAEGKPRLVLVLSGGGARGAAHIGVLKVLEENHIVPDMVVGTSMGSIVGGLYAAGWSPDEIEALLKSVDWNQVFSDGVVRADKSYRRKQDDRPQMIASKIRFKGAKPYIPPGVLGGQSLELLLRSLEIQSTSQSDFDRLPIPYRAVAMDIGTGEAVVIGDGSLATAMRASMSIPGAFPPVDYEGKKLVDGGAAANLPVGIAQSLGATHVIAVDISSPLTTEGEAFTDFLKVFSHLNSILTVANRVQDTARLRDGDVLIRPELGDITFLAFDRASEAVAIGESAARAKVEALRAFAADDTTWRAFESRHHTRPEAETVIDRVRVENTSRIADEVIRQALTLPVGQKANDELLRPALLKLYNLDYFGVIRTRLETLPDGTRELVIDTPPPPYGRSRLQFGLSFAGDMRGDSQYAVSVRHQLLAANRLGGEWENVLQFGNTGVVQSSFYQPLDYGMKWFVQPLVGYRRDRQNLWVDGTAIAQYRTSRAEGRLDAGRVLGAWGELRAGVYFADARFENQIGLSGFPDLNEHRGAAEVNFRVDTEAARVFPRDGETLLLRYTKSAESLGSDEAFEQVYARGAYALSFGENTVRPQLEYGENLREVHSVFSLFPLGGLMHMSGLATNELLGEKVAFGELNYYRRLKKLDMAGIHVRVYVGATLEAGNVYDRDEPVTADSLKTGWSAFLGADTPIGPAYVAYGRSDGKSRIYMVIGDRF
jgi:NTE family protein